VSHSAAPARALDDRSRITDGLVHLTGVRPENRHLAAEIASLPDAIRGCADVKFGNVAALTEALHRFRAPAKAGKSC
jgi:hypothetical protein